MIIKRIENLSSEEKFRQRIAEIQANLKNTPVKDLTDEDIKKMAEESKELSKYYFPASSDTSMGGE